MGISINPATYIIEITSPTTKVTVNEIFNAIRTWEASLEGIAFSEIIVDAEGLIDLGNGEITPITIVLSSLWQIQYWTGVTIGYITDGNIVGGVNNTPIGQTGGSDTIILKQPGRELGVASPLTNDQHEALMKINNIDITASASLIQAELARKILTNKVETSADYRQVIIYNDDQVTPLFTFNVSSDGRIRSLA